MAQRPRRRNMPPKRDRTRAPGGRFVTSIPPLGREGRGSGAYDREVLKDETRGQRSTPGSSSAAHNRAERLYSMETWEAIQEAKAGDDSLLLPYAPTPSINPPRPRTLAAGYDKESRTLRVRFRDGTPWEYYDVPPKVWRNFRNSDSPGRFIRRVLDNYEYGKGDF